MVELVEEKEIAPILGDFGTMFLGHSSKDEISKLFANRIQLYVYPPTSKINNLRDKNVRYCTLLPIAL